MIIDTSYFIGEIHSNQIGAGSSTKVNNNTSMQIFIDQNEVELLDKALGEELRREFYTQLDPLTGKVIVGADAKWFNLRDGTTYTKNGINYYWRGLVKDEDSTFKTSLFAYYVYHKYETDKILQVSGVRAVQTEAQNASNASAVQKLTRAWRNMYEWYMGECNYFTQYHHRGVLVTDYLGGHSSNTVSLYQFLSDNKEDYTNWRFTPIENINSYGV